MNNRNNLNELEIKILYYIHQTGPAYIKKLCQRLREDNDTIRKHIKKLEQLGYLERVSGRLVEYRIDRRNKVVKHRNHTYYDITRKGKHFIRRTKLTDIEVDLKPPYKRT
ncbi:Uncharacterized protein SAMN06265339_0139 [Desulfurobacterium pacificum]|uniref:DUF2250 domain-containing protein n=1 Tax=Desulfurobacterium pacificum TaxID=240166 RepID=A0ABY1N8Z2_9BACT|nr:DUF2250 domain-containing protein [Desulfurobacterium pacificum]SMP03712.1 Uncharacterized protein SAMN06265339_0139 [Desulfurobacterium pacificum]